MSTYFSPRAEAKGVFSPDRLRGVPVRARFWKVLGKVLEGCGLGMPVRKFRTVPVLVGGSCLGKFRGRFWCKFRVRFPARDRRFRKVQSYISNGSGSGRFSAGAQKGVLAAPKLA